MNCKRCGHPEDNHPFRHPFDADGTGPNPFNKANKPGQEASGTPSVVESSFPFDPVLRQALINRGVITPQDLLDADVQIRMVTGMAMKAVPTTPGGANDHA